MKKNSIHKVLTTVSVAVFLVPTSVFAMEASAQAVQEPAPYSEMEEQGEDVLKNVAESVESLTEKQHVAEGLENMTETVPVAEPEPLMQIQKGPDQAEIILHIYIQNNVSIGSLYDEIIAIIDGERYPAALSEASGNTLLVYMGNRENTVEDGRFIFFENDSTGKQGTILLNTKEDRENIYDGEATLDPDEGESETPDEGESETPDGGGSQTPDEGESETPDEGESETPDEGESETPDEGESETPDGGGSETPDEGESEAPDGGGSETPDEGETGSPSIPSEGNTDSVLEEQIPEEEVPLVDNPFDSAEEEINIQEEEVPLTQQPDIIPAEGGEGVVILQEEIPLSEVPMTGDSKEPIFFIFSFITAILGMKWLKRKENQ